MQKVIREQDAKLIELLQTNIQAKSGQTIPQDVIEESVYCMIEHIRKNTRVKNDLLPLDANLHWNPKTQQLIYFNEEIYLTRMERELLTLLCSGPNRAYSYESIFYALWGENDLSKQESLKTIVKKLRKKLPKKIIENIFGFGYKIILEKQDNNL
jgi:DNA-binding response OmpR family regulator